MKKAPYISIIVVAYNYENLLPRCLDAIIGQSFKDYEIVIVNNGSTDNSAELIDKYVATYKDVCFQVVNVEKNIGLPNGRNVGIEVAKGTYIIFNDADDWMADGCLEILAHKAQGTDADKVAGFYSEVDTEGKVLRICGYPDGFSNWMSTSLQAVLFKRKYFVENNIRVPLATKMDDIYINLTFHSYAKHTEYVKKSIYNYYVNLYSTSGAKNNNKKWNSTTLIEDCFDIFMPVYNRVTGHDKVMMEYVLIKQYYFFYLHNNRYVDRKLAIENYESAKEIIQKNCPNYLNNSNICLLKKNGDRRSGQIIVWLLSKIEKLHMMKGFIAFYLLISKKHYLVP